MKNATSGGGSEPKYTAKNSSSYAVAVDKALGTATRVGRDLESQYRRHAVLRAQAIKANDPNPPDVPGWILKALDDNAKVIATLVREQRLIEEAVRARDISDEDIAGLVASSASKITPHLSTVDLLSECVARGLLTREQLVAMSTGIETQRGHDPADVKDFDD